MPAQVGKPKAKKADAPRGREQKSAAGDERGRESRAQSTRQELFERVDESQPYVRPGTLEAPTCRPGFKQRWIRVGQGGQIDERNLAKKMREGWRARAADSVPKGFHVPRIRNGEFAGTIMVEGMLLCEMPESLAKRRDEAIRRQTDEKTRAIDDNLMRINREAGGGFGPIRKGAQSKLVRERKATTDATEEEAL